MGNRSVIQIDSESLPYPISFYGHWSGEDNLKAVKELLDANYARIGDVSYFAAQLFYKFAVQLGGYDGDLSFGIDSQPYDEQWLDNPIVYVNADTGEYTYNGQTFDREHNPIGLKRCACSECDYATPRAEGFCPDCVEHNCKERTNA